MLSRQSVYKHIARLLRFYPRFYQSLYIKRVNYRKLEALSSKQRANVYYIIVLFIEGRRTHFIFCLYIFFQIINSEYCFCKSLIFSRFLLLTRYKALVIIWNVIPPSESVYLKHHPAECRNLNIRMFVGGQHVAA